MDFFHSVDNVEPDNDHGNRHIRDYFGSCVSVCCALAVACWTVLMAFFTLYLKVAPQAQFVPNSLFPPRLRSHDARRL